MTAFVASGCSGIATTATQWGFFVFRKTLMSKKHTRPTSKERLLEKISINENGCWCWTSSIKPNGYGCFWHDGAQRNAHRVSYELFIGPIPEGLDLDHLCRNRACVNPEHLEPVTRSVNLNKGLKKSKVPKKLFCKNGHEFTQENTAVYEYVRGRRCKTCANATAKKYRDSKKAGI